MTDLSPNDLSHLSDAEFQSLCPQGEHAPGPEPLSPAAHAVMDAAFSVYDCEALYSLTEEQHASMIAAAALRAAAAHLGSCNASDELIRIATELEGHD